MIARNWSMDSTDEANMWLAVEAIKEQAYARSCSPEMFDRSIATRVMDLPKRKRGFKEAQKYFLNGKLMDFDFSSDGPKGFGLLKRLIGMHADAEEACQFLDWCYAHKQEIVTILGGNWLRLEVLSSTVSGPKMIGYYMVGLPNTAAVNRSKHHQKQSADSVDKQNNRGSTSVEYTITDEELASASPVRREALLDVLARRGDPRGVRRST